MPITLAGKLVQASKHAPGLSNIVSLFALSLIAAFVIVETIGTVVYNIYFHPLAKYPGPKYAASTALAYWAVTAKGDILPWIQDIHNKYGEVVRIGPDWLSYTSPEAWRDIYGHRTAGKKANPKDARHYTKDINGRVGLNAIFDDEEHGRVRRIFAHAFSDKALKEQEPIFVRYVDQLVATMRRSVDQEQDLVKLFTCTTFDIMGDLTFGEPLGLLDNAKYSPWVEATFGWIKAADLSRVTIEYPLLGRVAGWLTPQSVLDQQKMHFQHSVDRVDRRLKLGSDQPDIWNLVLRQPEGRRLDIEDMYSHSSVFMIAGTETTATLLSGLMYFLCQNPEKMKILCDEIRGSFASDAELTIENLQKLRYMAACFEEGLRLYPPLPIGPPREAHPQGNIICGQWVPGKTRISVAQYTAYRSPLNFRDPKSFVPERWLPNTGYDSDKRDVLQPFSYGPRNCVGKNLAYHEMRIILAKVLFNFDVELHAGSDGWIDQKCYTLWQKTPLWVTVKPVR
ncbi:Cytochrome p450 protein [Neofusicoccum parvum]|nr:Cytochrome p450 protein [Neofusicoccum parvum]